MREKRDDLLLVDGGDMLISPKRKKKLPPHHLKTRGETFFRSLTRMEYDVFVPGELDLKVGMGTIEELSKRSGLHTVLLNLYRDGRRVFEGIHETMKSGASILVTGIVSEGLIKREYREWTGFYARDPLQELEGLWNEAGGRVDVFVVVSHMLRAEEKKLMENLSFPALILSAHSGYGNDPVSVGKSVLLSIPDRGRYVGKVSLKGDRGNNLPFGGYYGEGQEKHLKRRIQILSAQREGVKGGGEARGYEDEIGLLETRLAEMKEMVAVGFEKIALHEKVPSDGEISVLLEEYRDQVGKGSYEPPVKEAYRGASYCRGCHEEHYALWSGGAHFRAYDTLVMRSEEMNPDCLVCHTTGFGEGGYHSASPRRTEFEGVGCEECHGPGSNHPGEKLPIPGGQMCRECHSRGDHVDLQGEREKIGCEKK